MVSTTAEHCLILVVWDGRRVDVQAMTVGLGDIVVFGVYVDGRLLALVVASPANILTLWLGGQPWAWRERC